MDTPPNSCAMQQVTATETESSAASAQLSSPAHPPQNSILPLASHTTHSTRHSHVTRPNSVVQKPLRSSPLAELAFSRNPSSEPEQSKPSPPRQSSAPNMSTRQHSNKAVYAVRPRSADATSRSRSQLRPKYLANQNSDTSTSRTIRSRSTSPSKSLRMRGSYGQPEAGPSHQSTSRPRGTIPPSSSHHSAVHAHSRLHTSAPDFPRVHCRDESDSWLTANPYLATPRFTRLSLASDNVVLPVSAREYRRRTLGSDQRTSKFMIGPASRSRPQSLMSALSSIEDIPNTPPQVGQFSSSASSRTVSSAASSSISLDKSAHPTRLPTINGVEEFGVVVEVVEMNVKPGAPATIGKGFLAKFLQIRQQSGVASVSAPDKEDTNSRSRVKRFFTLKRRSKA
ncbi:hypothetical protein HGRIS_012552 [Hohenbuehelia grisea]|uniref:Uncharacterized protein n=1 Tax=Hohenbuehelia grisea TaxID=104357 RepID=A0ABR3ISN1_9AGAR